MPRKNCSYAFICSNTENTISQTKLATVERRRTIDAFDGPTRRGSEFIDLKRSRLFFNGDRRLQCKNACFLYRSCHQTDRHRAARCSICLGLITAIRRKLGLVFLAMRRKSGGRHIGCLCTLRTIGQTQRTAEIETQKGQYEPRHKCHFVS